MIDKPIYVTSPLLPSRKELDLLLDEIWKSKLILVSLRMERYRL